MDYLQLHSPIRRHDVRRDSDTEHPVTKDEIFSLLLLFNHHRRWPMNQTNYLHYAYRTDNVFTKLFPTEYASWVGPRAGLVVSKKRKPFALPGNLTPDSPSIRRTKMKVADLSLPAAR